MTTICLLLVFAGFYAGYVSSQRASGTHFLPMRNWARKHATASRSIGLVILAAAAVAFARQFGTGPGILFFAVTLMTLGSLLLVLAPLRMVKGWMVAMSFAAALITETALF